MVFVVPKKLFDRDNHRSESALHIGRAAAVQLTVLDRRFERIGTPFRGIPWRHDVGVPGKTQDRRDAAATSPKICRSAENHGFAFKPKRLKAPDQKLLTARVVRRYRCAPDEIREEFNFRLCRNVIHIFGKVSYVHEKYKKSANTSFNRCCSTNAELQQFGNNSSLFFAQ